LLQNRGWVVEVFLYGDAQKLPPDARVNFERWEKIGAVSDARSLIGWTGACYDLVVDAIFGTGLTRPLSAEAAEILKFISMHPLGKVVAVDAISGVDMDSGQPLCDAEASHVLNADLVVSFHKQKLGHHLGQTCQSVDKVVTVDIGLAGFDEGDGQVSLLNLREETPDLDKGVRPGGGHKFSHGHALVLSGVSGQTGAARLAARGALRIGAGLVTLGVPAAALNEVAAQLTAVMLKPLEDAEELLQVLVDSRINALCLGPALGLSRAKALVKVALAANLATVLDADALSGFADDPSVLFSMLHETCVLTPHAGEFARLFPDISEKLQEVPTSGQAYSKVDATREAAARAGCVVLFKGADTVIAAPDGRCSINSAQYDRKAPWLATAGAGDVLAGFITGLLARGFDPMTAAETAAWLHVESARQFGPGLIAEDLPEQLPAVFRDLGI
jgi:hydroxyethylthiazole kinase-like uncharacterized protein yjeF